jgi:predicted MFS family arabinose efflux permease
MTSTGLRATPGFTALLLARTVSWTGSAITLVALPLALYRETGDVGAAALVTAAESAPYLLFGLLAGAFADRWPRRRTMVWTSTAAGLLTAVVPLASAAGALSTPLLLAVALAVATCLVFFDAAGFGLLPAIVARDRLAEANSLSTAVNTAITLLGPALGGVLVATVGPADALAVDAVSFGLAAVLLLRVTESTGTTKSASLRADIVEGLRFLRHHRTIRAYTLLGTVNSLVGGAVTGLLVAFAVDRFGLSGGDARIGLCYTTLGAGTLVAAMTAPRLGARLGFARTASVALGLGIVGLIGWSLAAGLAPGLVFLALWQYGSSTFILTGITVRMRLTPDVLQGRVNTTARMLAWGGQPFGAALAGTMVGVAGLSTPLLAGAALLTAATVVALVRERLTVSGEFEELGQHDRVA